jgi:hypothetical protein
MHEWDLRLRASDHCDELRGRAAAERMVRWACAGDPEHRRLLCRVVIWLGGRLEALGAAMQKHFMAPAPARPAGVWAGR